MKKTKSELVSLVVASLPISSQIKDFDLDSESDAIRFTWRGTRFRVDDSLSVGTVHGGCLTVSSDLTMIYEQHLKLVDRLGLHKAPFGEAAA